MSSKIRWTLLSLTLGVSGCEERVAPAPPPARATTTPHSDARQVGREIGSAARKVGDAVEDVAVGIKEGVKEGVGGSGDPADRRKVDPPPTPRAP